MTALIHMYLHSDSLSTVMYYTNSGKEIYRKKGKSWKVVARALIIDPKYETLSLLFK